MGRDKPRRAGPTHIEDILKKAIGEISSDKKHFFYKEEIEKAWEEAAGKQASKHSMPIQIRRNTLIVNVDSPIWIYQLNIKKTEIEKKLAKILKQEKPLCIRLRAGEET